MTVSPATFPSTHRITIVLVHGAWTNGSGWRPVHDRLIEKGHSVVVTQQPLTSFEADVAAVARVLAMQPGPVVLVGHCYGGAVITRVGNDPKVRALVYIAAHALEENETPLGNDRKFVDPASHAGADVRTTPEGFLYFEPSAYIEDYAADLDPATALFQAHAQVPTALGAFDVPATHPAWKDKPSWYMVAGADRILSPDLERMYGRRAGSTVVEVPGASHAVHQSHPQEVTRLIEEAAASCHVLPD
ncbi:alpha/beta fold hydrolase [Luteibacter sp. Lutesp34]|uniref:alpha/beta fold hydrolase n=1 Tax=Luteibacter sp. Lutesp34 TaxID=3243030 RepID=UPI0039B46C44